VKKGEKKGEFEGCQVSAKLDVKSSPSQQPTTCNRSAVMIGVCPAGVKVGKQLDLSLLPDQWVFINEEFASFG
jgi:hypothetical protein